MAEEDIDDAHVSLDNGTWGKGTQRTCLKSHLQTSPPTPQPGTTFENTPLFRPKMS